MKQPWTSGSRSREGRRRRCRDVVKVAVRRGTRLQVQAAQFIGDCRVFLLPLVVRQILARVVLAVRRQTTAVRHVRRQLAARGQHQTDVRRRRLQRTGQILRVILNPDEVRVICTHTQLRLTAFQTTLNSPTFPLGAGDKYQYTV